MKEHPEVLRILPKDDLDPTRTSNPWNESNLKAILGKIVSIEGLRTFILIDGLDEFEDGKHATNRRVCEVLNEIESNANGHLKICCSSRPTKVFSDQFCGKAQLSMQSLTESDIKTYVEQKLGDKCSEQLIDEVLTKAQGVFLWVALAVSNLQDGIDIEDSPHELEERLGRLPEGLDGLFTHMLGLIDPSVRKEAAKYFHITLMSASSAHNSPICEWVVALNEEYFELGPEPITGANVIRLCDDCRKLEKRIKFCTAGLCEVSPPSPGQKWILGQKSDDSETQKLWPFIDLLYPQFIHRTVTDFLHKTGEYDAALHDEVRKADFEIGSLRCFIVLLEQSETLGLELSDIGLIHGLLDAMSTIRRYMEDKKLALDEYVSRLKKALERIVGTRWENLRLDNLCFSESFLELCAESGLRSYVDQILRIDISTPDHSMQQMLDRMLCACLSWCKYLCVPSD